MRSILILGIDNDINVTSCLKKKKNTRKRNRNDFRIPEFPTDPIPSSAHADAGETTTNFVDVVCFAVCEIKVKVKEFTLTPSEIIAKQVGIRPMQSTVLLGAKCCCVS